MLLQTVQKDNISLSDIQVKDVSFSDKSNQPHRSRTTEYGYLDCTLRKQSHLKVCKSHYRHLYCPEHCHDFSICFHIFLICKLPKKEYFIFIKTIFWQIVLFTKIMSVLCLHAKVSENENLFSIFRKAPQETSFMSPNPMLGNLK